MPVPIILGKTGEAFVNRVFDILGVINEPRQRIANAKADIEVAKHEVEAAVIRAEGQLRITEVQARGLQRMIHEEGKNQENIEAITAKAIPHLSPDAKPEELNQDFVRYLFDKAKLVSNEEMQEVLAKILAGEVNKPQAFSRRTLELVSQMDKDDVELFVRLCKSVWNFGGPFPIIPTTDMTPPDDEFSLAFIHMQHLASIGLIHFEANNERYFVIGAPGEQVAVRYAECVVELNFERSTTKQVRLGRAVLSSSGIELWQLLGTGLSREAYETGIRYMLTQDITISTPVSAKNTYLSTFGGA